MRLANGIVECYKTEVWDKVLVERWFGGDVISFTTLKIELLVVMRLNEVWMTYRGQNQKYQAEPSPQHFRFVWT